ncbi:catalase-related domain-containing protein [Methylobacterium sp. Leaf117]|uniref:catalase-related domain-containing protein n=1 Tax=Methylobacterium sp. Leaf117 TaxID=1736260 RepID=UPI001910B044|nr:catalase-related domain-containing protein [Methylobacterium sp. Leaf117]
MTAIAADLSNAIAQGDGGRDSRPDAGGRQRLVETIVSAMGDSSRAIRERLIGHWYKVHPDFGRGVAEGRHRRRSGDRRRNLWAASLKGPWQKHNIEYRKASVRPAPSACGSQGFLRANEKILGRWGSWTASGSPI